MKNWNDKFYCLVKKDAKYEKAKFIRIKY